jgi:hypothetical protein
MAALERPKVWRADRLARCAPEWVARGLAAVAVTAEGPALII